jgi:hypothetical protein
MRFGAGLEEHAHEDEGMPPGHGLPIVDLIKRADRFLA